MRTFTSHPGVTSATANQHADVNDQKIDSLLSRAWAGHSLGGTVAGLTSDGLILAANGETVTVNSDARTFAFATPIATETAYAVTVQSTPSGLACSVAGAIGIMGTANVNNVVVTCSNRSYALGGTVKGLNGPGLVLANGTDRLAVASGATVFVMPSAVAHSSSFAVTVAMQPSRPRSNGHG